MAKAFSRQEQLFFKRVALKMAKGETVEQGLQRVLADDKRVWETLITMPDRCRAEFITEISKSVCDRIRGAKKGFTP